MTVPPSTDWSAAVGPVWHSDIYDGEFIDLRNAIKGWNALELASGAKWSAARLAGPPTPTTLVTSHAVLPKIGIRSSYSPCAMYESSPGVYVFDFCQNMAGFVTFAMPAGVTGPEAAGRKVSMLHAEAVHGPPPAAIFHHYGAPPPRRRAVARRPHGSRCHWRQHPTAACPCYPRRQATPRSLSRSRSRATARR